MRQSLAVFFLLILSLPLFSQGETEQYRLNIHVIKENRKTATEKIHLNDSVQIQEYIRNELFRLHSKGYLTAYDSLSGSGKEVNAFIRSGVRFMATDDSIFVSDRFLTVTNNRKYYSYKRNQNALSGWVKEFGNTGYPFVRIEADSMISGSRSVSFRYQIHKGPYILNDSIAIHGEKVLKQKFLIQYLQILPGKPYSEKTYAQAAKSISQLGFVVQSRPPDIWFGTDKARLNLYLKKKSANQFQGIAGIVPPSGSDTKTTVTGDVTLALNNTFGHADKIGLNWKKYDRYGQQLDAAFVFPYLFYLPTGVDLRFNLLKKDSSYLTTEFRWGLPFYFQAGNHAGILFERKSSDILTENPGLYTADFKRNAAGIYLRWNNFDRPVIPRKGAGIELNALAGRKESVSHVQEDTGLPVQTDFFEQTSLVSFSWPLSPLIGIKAEGASGFISGQNILMNEMPRIGGYKSLKGFDEESIYVQNFASAGAELKIFLGDYSNVFAFFNQACYRRFVPVDISDTPFGFGWGIELDTPAGILSLVYALGRQFDNPIAIRDSKVHISLLNRF